MSVLLLTDSEEGYKLGNSNN